MFYLTIPLGLALIALIGAVVIIWRKMPFLRRLTPEAHEVGDTWLHDMAPEMINWFRNIQWQEYKHKFLVEIERLIHKMQSFMSAINRASDKLSKKVRRGHIQAARQVQEQQAQIIESVKEKLEEKEVEEPDREDPDQLKLREQALIVQIAQDPKDVELYSELAAIYVKLKNYADAVESLSAALKIEPDNESLIRRLEAAKKRLAEQGS